MVLDDDMNSGPFAEFVGQRTPQAVVFRPLVYWENHLSYKCM